HHVMLRHISSRLRLHVRPRRADAAPAVGRRAGDAQDRADGAIPRQSRPVLRRARGVADAAVKLFDDQPHDYDAVLVVSFGGPEGPDDVLPFLDNVFRGVRGVTDETKARIAERYQQFAGVSPINAHTRAFIDALREDLARSGPALPVYWGNRNWHPLLPDTLEQMSRDGVRRAIAWVTSTFSSYSGCRKYREDLYEATQGLADPPAIDRLRHGFNHPGFVEAMADRVREALAPIAPERRGATPVIFTAHSLPESMARHAPYEAQL